MRQLRLALSAAILLAAGSGCEQNSNAPAVDSTDSTSVSTHPPAETAAGGTDLKIASQPLNRDAITYRSIRPVFWSELYGQGGQTLYCKDSFEADRGRGFNVEHVLPMSWATRFLKCGSRKQCRRNSRLFNVIESDMHNLFPTRTALNDARRRYAFGVIAGETRPFQGCDFEVDHQRRVVEPADSVRGEIARAMLYMELTYGIPLFRDQREMLLSWAKDDPVDEQEMRRNRLIGEIQNRRNPYIDDSSVYEAETGTQTGTQ